MLGKDVFQFITDKVLISPNRFFKNLYIKKKKKNQKNGQSILTLFTKRNRYNSKTYEKMLNLIQYNQNGN